MIIKDIIPLETKFDFGKSRFVDYVMFRGERFCCYQYFRSCQCFVILLTLDEERLLLSKDVKDQEKFNKLFLSTLSLRNENKEEI